MVKENLLQMIQSKETEVNYLGPHETNLLCFCRRTAEKAGAL